MRTHDASFPTRRSSDLTNSLLDLIVFGRAAALRAAELVKPGSRVPETNGHTEERAMQRFDRIRHSKGGNRPGEDRKSTRLNSSHMSISYAVFCLKKKNQ